MYVLEWELSPSHITHLILALLVTAASDILTHLITNSLNYNVCGVIVWETSKRLRNTKASLKAAIMV